MKTINILSLVEAHKNLNHELYTKFKNLYGIDIKDEEVVDLKHIINNIMKIEKNIKYLSHYFVGYKIPQIGKEFDLVRFGEDCVINIEVKNSSTEEKVLKQLERNHYYLSFLNKDLYCFSYIVNENKLYYLDNYELNEVDFTFLVKILKSQKIIDVENIDSLFDPTNYLVSPFNTTKKFIKDKYFLTHQQEEFKSKILKRIKDKSKVNFIAITGSAGTGKTLLTYDIAKTVMSEGKKVLIIHCGILNDGQEKLKEKYNWEIISIKSYKSIELSAFDLIIIDEAQRIYPNQFNEIVKNIQSSNGNCIFSYDKAQTLHKKEEKRDIDSKITSLLSIEKCELSKKIRTNEEIANFIIRLFNRNRNNLPVPNDSNIEITFYKKKGAVKAYQEELKQESWQIIRFTPSQYDKEYHEDFFVESDTSHSVIGQEFDQVAIVIDDRFFYNEDGKLQYKGRSYYHPVKMLFQNLTRARKKLHLIIVNNEEVLDRCLDILDGGK